MTIRKLVVVALIVVLAPGCRGSSGPPVRLDGSPRFPDLEGIATNVSLNRIEIAGRRLKVSRSLQSFSTYDLSPAPLLGREGQYVQAGVNGDVVEWLAGIGVVVRPAGVVYFVGNLVGVERGRAVFRDGTTLGLSKGVSASPRGRVRAEIHAARRVITAITPSP